MRESTLPTDGKNRRRLGLGYAESWMNTLLLSRTTKAFVFCAALVPLLVLTWQWRHHELGVNWIEAAQHRTGDWILRFLILTLAITPLRKVPGLNPLIRYRRMLGLFAFFYGCVHFGIYLWYDKALDWQDIQSDFLTRRFYAMGLLAFLLLIPLAITSTRGWVRRLGGRRWQLLHRLIYVSAAAGALHYYWQGKSIVPKAVEYAAVVAALLLYRLAVFLRKARAAQTSPPPMRREAAG
jgi:sulfoxide reductase heme-binding subunit YedZ